MDIKELVQYKNWANTTYIDYCQDLSQEDYEKEITGYSNSIRKILTHLLGVYWFWYEFITTQNYDDEPDFDNMSKDQVINGLKEYNEKIIDFVKTQDAAKKFTINWREEDKPVETTAENIIFNFVTHSAYHRGQLAIYLRIIGIDSIIETDFNPYVYQMGQR
ncbi:MAG: DinB family protein [Candidatus Kariarchaeaceae archaeon]|jgi:uncharacterized damage-inducible protein DinB